MADDQAKLPQRLRIFDQAVWRKWNRYAISGLVTILIGFVVIDIGLFLFRANFSVQALVIGLGALVMLIGIIRLLIGFINPATPADLEPEKPAEEKLNDVIFEQPPQEGNL